MKNQITIKPIDSVHSKVLAPPNVFSALRDHYSVYVENYQFMPSYKYGNWDGKKRFLHLNGKTYNGLIPEIKKFAREKGMDVNDERTGVKHNITNEEFVESLKTFNLDKYRPYKHQIRGSLKAIKNKNGILYHATGSGKTLTATLVMNYVYNHLGKEPILYITPRRNLVEQTITNLTEEYGLPEDAVTQYGGENREQDLEHPIVISTWQILDRTLKEPKDYIVRTTSGGIVFVDDPLGAAKELNIKDKETRHKLKDIVESGSQFNYKHNSFARKYDKTKHKKRRKDLLRFFDNLKMLVVDECHQAHAKTINNVVSEAKHTEFKIGLTGTMREEEDEAKNMLVKGLIGPVIDEVHEPELIEKGHLSEIKVNLIYLDHDEYFQDYHEERQFLEQNKRRNKVITSLAEAHARKNKNVLVLVDKVENHGKPLMEMYDPSGDISSYFVHGKVRSKKREKIRKKISDSLQNVLFATYGTYQVGVDIPSLHVIILAVIGKAKIRLLQSIGRGLRTHESKDELIVYDICDQLKYSDQHADKRLKYYNKRDYPIDVITDDELQAHLQDL